MQREFDIIIYGASGYTARYVIKEFEKTDIKLALAGRNLKSIQQNIGTETKYPILQCEASEISKISCLTTLLINCAGPYIFSGEDIVEGCIQTGTHYMDITGETYFIERILKRFGEEAKSKNLFIINCCGFDSIPADLGVEYLKRNFGGGCEILSVISTQNAYLNKATYESFIYALKNEGKMRDLRGKTAQSGSKSKKYFYNEETKSYNLIFMGTDPSVVRRTQNEMVKKNMDMVKYKAYIDIGSWISLQLAKILFLVIYLLSKFDLGTKILLKFPGFFTLGRCKTGGPDEKLLEKGSFTMKFCATRGDEEKRMIISGPDVGYFTTSICLSQAALCFLELLKDPEGSGVEIFEGGILTPGCVFHGSDLVERLCENGIEFKIFN